MNTGNSSDALLLAALLVLAQKMPECSDGLEKHPRYVTDDGRLYTGPTYFTEGIGENDGRGHKVTYVGFF